MTNSPLWSCYVHAITNFLTVGMESYIAMLFALRLWLMITKKNAFKIWLLEHTKILTYIFGFGFPIVLSVFSILPQLLKGKNFVIPPKAENCITGYRTNPWQVVLSGPGTTLPPFVLSASFAVNIVLVLCTVSTNNIMKDVKKFSTISYSSWIRMLWFGVLFGLVVVINITGDIKNAKAMAKNGTLEPGIKNISIPYYITAGVGIGVLLIFGTTPEAKKKISSLVKNTLSGVTSLSGKKSQSQSQSQSQNHSRNPSQNFSFAQDISTKASNYSMSSINASSITIKVDSNSSFQASRNNMNMNSPLPLIKNSIKPKKAVGELEATLEFNKFMKSINDEVREDEDDGFLFKNMYQNNTFAYGDNNKIYSEIKDYSVNPQRGNITPRMMIPIQKFSNERIHQQQQIQQYNSSNSFSSDEYNFNTRDDRNLVNKTRKYSEADSDQATFYQSTIVSGYNNSQMDSFIRMEDDNRKGYSENNYVRDGVYTEEIVYPAKVSTSKIVKQ